MTTESSWPPSEPLETLAARAAGGDESALTAFLAILLRIAFSVARTAFLFPIDDAKDIAQEVGILVVVRKLHHERLAYAAWVMTSAKYACLRFLRSRATEQRALARLESTLRGRTAPHPVQARIETGAWDVSRAIDRLPPNARAVVRMRYTLGMEWAEIDAVLFDGRKKSRYRGFAALKVLVKMLKVRPRK